MRTLSEQTDMYLSFILIMHAKEVADSNIVELCAYCLIFIGFQQWLGSTYTKIPAPPGT